MNLGMSRRGFTRSIPQMLAASWLLKTKGLTKESSEDYADIEKRLLPSAERLGPPKPGEWLAGHPEAGQDFVAYLQSRPIQKSKKLRTIYVSTLGKVPEPQKEIFQLVLEYLSIFFASPVKMHEQWSIESIPAEAQRTNATTGKPQVLTRYVLGDLLLPTRPKDALAYLALTAIDLWPGEGWNFVFGQGSLRDRTGVWSTARNGNIGTSAAERGLFLRRTIGTASHETMHLLSMPHCKEFRCLVNGSNSLSESDTKPLVPCPTCERKLSWNLQQKPNDRYRKLADFCRRNGLEADAISFESKLRALQL